MHTQTHIQRSKDPNNEKDPNEKNPNYEKYPSENESNYEKDLS